VIRLDDQCDVLVVGAGPAGSTAAQLLASWGWSVVLVHRAASPPGRPSLAESLPSSTRKLFAFLGQLDRIEAASFYPNEGNVARWARASRATRSADAGFHVSRGAFDQVLRDSAVAAGARVVDAVVRRVEAGDPIEVTYATDDRRIETCAARFVLDCSGRAGVVARRGLRRADSRYRTLAIAAEWECAGWPADEHTRTLVESYRDGWAWSVPLSKTRRQCTVMIDPGRSPAASPELSESFDERRGERLALREVYTRELEKSVELRRRLVRATQVSTPWTCDASIYDAPRAADQGVLLVGDAASFIEPLSSAGVKKALLSAWRAAVVANTCLRNQTLAGAALDLYIGRERRVYAECMRRSNAFFAEAAAAYGTSFWSTRAADADGLHPAEEEADVFTSDVSDAALARDPDVRLAFDHLRASEHVRLRAAAALRFEPVAIIEGREVVMRDALILPGLDAPLQFAAGVNLPALARLATACGDVPALIAAYHAQVGPVPLTGLLTGLSLLVARHALVAEASTSTRVG
jgi:flavin-dependent dehydrogenase